MTDATAFIVSDDPAVRDALSELAASGGLQAETFPSLAAWHGVVPAARRGCLLLDARAEDLAGAARRAQLRAACAVRPVLLLADRGDVPTTVSAMRAGVFEVVEKPPRNGHLLERIRLAAASQPARRST
jgi:FixJ family two-component response regulator